MVYAWFAQDLRKVYAWFAQGLRVVYAWFAQNCSWFAQVYAGLRRDSVYARLRMVYARFTQGLRKVYAGLRRARFFAICVNLE